MSSTIVLKAISSVAASSVLFVSFAGIAFAQTGDTNSPPPAAIGDTNSHPGDTNSARGDTNSQPGDTNSPPLSTGSGSVSGTSNPPVSTAGATEGGGVQNSTGSGGTGREGNALPGAVLGTSTPSGPVGAGGGFGEPGIPNTGAGGEAILTFAVLAASALLAGGSALYALMRRVRASRIPRSAVFGRFLF